MKIIFLNIDGVLNCKDSKSRCEGVVGVDKDKIRRLANIIGEDDIRLILTSTGWGNCFTKSMRPVDKYGEYLSKHLWNHGKLRLAGKTPDAGSRSKEIMEWFATKETWNIESWIIIDSEDRDYEEFGFVDRWLKTDKDKGLQDEDVGKAIELLGKENNGEEKN